VETYEEVRSDVGGRPPLDLTWPSVPMAVLLPRRPDRPSSQSWLSNVELACTACSAIPEPECPAGGFCFFAADWCGRGRSRAGVPVPPQPSSGGGTGGACATRAWPAGATVRAASAARLDPWRGQFGNL